jgi:hypothetical protein
MRDTVGPVDSEILFNVLFRAVGLLFFYLRL